MTKMATKVSKGDLPQLLSWLQNHLPSSFKLHEELQSHLRGKFPDLDFFVDRWPDPQAAAAVVDPACKQLMCKAYYQNMVLGVSGTADEAVAVVLGDDRVVDWRSPLLFTAVAEKHWSVLQRLAEEKGGMCQCWSTYMLTATQQDLQPVKE